MTDFLYRGVNEALYQTTGGRRLPKACGDKFQRAVHYREQVYYGDGSVHGKSERNAVVMHQRDSSKYPSSGVSTTPNFEHAVRYATYEEQGGYVYKIDVDQLEAHGVRAFPVDQHASSPAIPDDYEVILVASDYGPLPNGIIVEVIAVHPTA